MSVTVQMLNKFCTMSSYTVCMWIQTTRASSDIVDLFTLTRNYSVHTFSVWDGISCKMAFIHKACLATDSLNRFQLLPVPEGQRGNEPAQMHSDSVCASSVWPAGGAETHTVSEMMSTEVTDEHRSCDISPRGWGPASVSAGYQWTPLRRGAWLEESACPLWTTRTTMTTCKLQSCQLTYSNIYWTHFTFWPRFKVINLSSDL